MRKLLPLFWMLVTTASFATTITADFDDKYPISASSFTAYSDKVSDKLQDNYKINALLLNHLRISSTDTNKTIDIKSYSKIGTSATLKLISYDANTNTYKYLFTLNPNIGFYGDISSPNGIVMENSQIHALSNKEIVIDLRLSRINNSVVLTSNTVNAQLTSNYQLLFKFKRNIPIEIQLHD